MRAKVSPDIKHAIDGVLPGTEGDFVDTLATRALIKGGLLLPLDELPPEPPPRATKSPRIAGDGDNERLRADFDRAWRQRVEEHRAELTRVRGEADSFRTERDQFAVRLDASEKALATARADGTKSTKLLREELDAARARIAEFEALAAKVGAHPQQPPAGA